MNKPNYKPCCPNHGEPLEGIGFPIPSKGTGVCPISGCSFDFEVEVDQEVMVKDKDGNMVKKISWQLTGEENN